MLFEPFFEGFPRWAPTGGGGKLTLWVEGFVAADSSVLCRERFNLELVPCTKLPIPLVRYVKIQILVNIAFCLTCYFFALLISDESNITGNR